jgi:2-polyprenyl-3-methyl-5-hydroxy-6-metoxy-1,4-benzoquinol methylase
MPNLLHRALRRLLGFPFVHYVATRMLGGRLRSLSFDERYCSGRWNFVEERGSELVALIEGYAGEGHILILGCGTASITGVLDPEKYASILGLDLSPVAISKAMQYANRKVHFEVGDMVRYEPNRKFSVILFSESLNYVSCRNRLPLLRRLCQHLTANGRIIVTIAQPERYGRLLKSIRTGFQVVEDRSFKGLHRHLIVFR